MIWLPPEPLAKQVDQILGEATDLRFKEHVPAFKKEVELPRGHIFGVELVTFDFFG